jgi:NADH:ubiquinone oxidoreductase subunit 6 (subunit J)
MNVVSVLFVIISTLGLLAALGTVLVRNLVHAALFLIAFFFIVACQFVLLEAEFLAAVQVLVYIGAVAILLMFGIMLTRNIQGDETTSLSPGWPISAILGGFGLLLILILGINNQVGKGANRREWKADQTRMSIAELEAATNQEGKGRARAINHMAYVAGRELMTRFAIPFEVAGLLLTVALVGAIALAHRDGDDAETPRRGVRATRPLGGTTVGQDGGLATVQPEAVTSTTS